VNTETPQHTCTAHSHWVLAIAWSPDGRKLASGCKNSKVPCSSFLYLISECKYFVINSHIYVNGSQKLCEKIHSVSEPITDRIEINENMQEKF